nr:hypothetical protein CFP56_60686 [Quercus suber]
MPSKVWNDATDRQLLLVMIHLAAPKLPNWDQVAELMGDNFTAAGVRVSAAHFGALGGSKSNNSSATTTPRKPKTMKDSMTPSGSNKKRKITTMPADDVDEASCTRSSPLPVGLPGEPGKIPVRFRPMFKSLCLSTIAICVRIGTSAHMGRVCQSWRKALACARLPDAVCMEDGADQGRHPSARLLVIYVVATATRRCSITLHVSSRETPAKSAVVLSCENVLAHLFQQELLFLLRSLLYSLAPQHHSSYAAPTSNMSNKRVTTNWESKETWERLVSAIIASGVKLDLREVAKYYGTTYDTLENRLRKVKKDAAILKEEVQTGERGEVPTPRTAPDTPKKPRTPKTPKTPKSSGGLDGL